LKADFASNIALIYIIAFLKGVLMEKKKPDPVKMKILRSFPVEIKQALTKDEVDAFLYKDEWPDSLKEKLKDYIVDEE
jgi:hypothetical protein